MKNDTLFIGGTHGDEPIGVNVLKRISESRQDFDWIIGNERAFEIGERSFEGDLNRSAPGDPNSDQYATRRAAEIITKSKQYAYTIDLHGSKTNCGIFIILTKLTRENLRLASMFAIEKIVYWPAVSEELNGPLSEFFTCGIEIECGLKTDPVVIAQLENIIMDFLDNRSKREEISWEDAIRDREIFEVYGSLKENPDKIKLIEGAQTNLRGEQFYPLLTNSYKKRNGILCYKMKKIEDILTHKRLS
jgi:hypothetical protein